jgi:hypothetical protein
VKRGLVAAADGSRPVYAARQDRLRGRLRAAGADVGLVYGDVYRSDDIAHLTNVCIYWNEGTIAVPVDGETAFLAKISARVHTWMRRTSVLEDLRASQKLPELIASYLDESGARTVAIVDREWWPSELVDGIAQAAGEVRLIDLPGAIRDTRLVPDHQDVVDLQTAGAIVAGALQSAAGAAGGPTDRLAAIERSARDAGARDVLAACRPLAAGATQVELTVQYANVWARAARVLPDPDPELAAAFAQARDALGSAVSGADLARLTARAEVGLVHHCDLGSGGDYRPAQDAADPPGQGAVVSLEVATGAGRLADTFHLGTAGAVALTGTGAQVTA